MNTWIVLARAPAGRLIERVLNEPAVRIKATWEFSSAMMRAGRIAGHDEQPVILVMDTDSVEERPIVEYRLEIGGYLRGRSGGTPSRLVLAIPQVEAVLFHDRAGLERALGRTLSYDEAFEARFRPRAVFERLVGEEDTEAKALAVIDRLDDAALRRMAEHPLIREIREFVDEMARREEEEELEEAEEEELEPLRRAG
ncbi:MAG TPA: hypothetical protein VF092_07995 [Longimicrobium sp.]